jgi:hypothetical protein
MEAGIAALLDVLDEDIRHLESTISRLDTLRSLLIKRDNGALEKLLDGIRQQADAYKTNEHKRQQLRSDLAADLGCTQRDLTLSKLQGELAGPTCPDTQRRCGAALADRQTRLRSLAARLKREYTLTMLLVRDCTRFNRSLMKVFFGSGGRGGARYSPTGAAKHEIGTTLMSMQF